MKFGDVVPREHGTWAMWIVPMLSAGLVTHFSTSFVLLFIAFGLFYLTHRPIVALMKNRHQADVKKYLLIISAPAIVLAIVLMMAFGLPWLILFWGIEAPLFAFSVSTFVERDQRYFTNELTILSALTLTAPAAYYAITGKLDAKAAQLFVLNFLFFGSGVFYLKARIALLQSKGKLTVEVRKSRVIMFVYHVALVAVIVLLHTFGSISILMLLVFIPMIVQVAVGMSSKKVKVDFTQIGVALIVQSVIFLAGVKLFWS